LLFVGEIAAGDNGNGFYRKERKEREKERERQRSIYLKNKEQKKLVFLKLNQSLCSWRSFSPSVLGVLCGKPLCRCRSIDNR
jgi:hypothetical protein